MEDTTIATETPEVILISPTQKAGYENGPLKLCRDEYGLLRNIDYVFDDNGFVSWRQMIDPKFLYPNKDWFEARKKEVPSSIEGLTDAQLLIQLGGIKELARIRGFNSVEFEIQNVDSQHVVAKCIIGWLPNYETNDRYVTFSDVANASIENCSGFGVKFLETIAANRAFVRAVRNFLNIHIVGADEIDKSSDKVIEIDESDNSPSALDPHANLKRHAVKGGFKTFEDFRGQFLDPLIKDKKYAPLEKPTNKWLDYSDIPVTECRRIIPLLKKK